MTATGRLLWIETRRSVGLWAFPVLVGLAWLAWRIQQEGAGHSGVALWPQTSVDIGFAVVFLGPAAGGLGAWVAGRDRRRGLEDLLATTPTPATRRALALLAATALWALLAFLAAGAYLGVLTAWEATWGAPVWPPLLVAALAIAVQAAIGYAAGSFAGSALTGRLTAALVPVGLFVAQYVPTALRGEEVMLGPRTGTSSYPYEHLAPWAVVLEIGDSVFWSPRMDLVWAVAAWLLGLGGLALATVALRHRWRSLVVWGTLAAAALAIVVGWTQLVPAPVFVEASPSRAIAYDPVCTQRSIAICLHPAYGSVLDETADLVDPVVRPLAGLPGFPVRAEQIRPAREAEAIGAFELHLVAAGADALAILPADSEEDDAAEAAYVAVAAVTGQAHWFLEDLNLAQSALAHWLMDQAGWAGGGQGHFITSLGMPVEDLFIPASLLDDPPCGEASTREGCKAMLDVRMADVRLAADRFGALSPEAQRAWLETNFSALRAGDLALEELP